MVLSPEHFIVLLSQLFLRCFGQVMDRFSRLIIQEQTWRMQISLDFLNAKHVCDRFIVENHLIFARAVIKTYL